MSRGFALVALPAQYDVTGMMTFIVNRDGVVYEKDPRRLDKCHRVDDDAIQPRIRPGERRRWRENA